MKLSEFRQLESRLREEFAVLRKAEKGLSFEQERMLLTAMREAVTIDQSDEPWS